MTDQNSVVVLTPDSLRYLAASKQRVPYPFHFRWLLPFVLKQNADAWIWVTRAAVAGIGGLAALYAGSPWMVCVSFLPALMFSWKHPILVDAPAMALALAGAVVWPYSPIASVALVLVAGCMRETSPVWAAIYAWNPIMLVGLVPVAVRMLWDSGNDVLQDEQSKWIMANPLRAGLHYHKGNWQNPLLMIAPWGGMVLGLWAMNAQLAVALAVGYGQMLVATDSVRLYQWSAPVVALACVNGLPMEVLPFVALSVVFNPWRGDGV